jgi:hypothetical protein
MTRQGAADERDAERRRSSFARVTIRAREIPGKHVAALFLIEPQSGAGQIDQDRP